MHRMLKIEWDAVAGVLAAVIAIVLHLLHVIEAEVLSVITLVLLAAMFLRWLLTCSPSVSTWMDLKLLVRSDAADYARAAERPRRKTAIDQLTVLAGRRNGHSR